MKDKAMLRRIVYASVIGSTVEWYDFFLYGVVAGIVFNKLYFPSDDITISTLMAYATFAVGFVARPLGGIIFGHFGDKLGRKKMLIITLSIMGLCTVLIGCLPTYNQIGVWAPIALLFLRVLQGIGLGGEWGGAVLLTFECAPENERSFYASLPQIGLALGLTLASGAIALLSYLMSDAQFMAWGWRVAFLASLVLVAIGMYIRLTVMESPEFQNVKEEKSDVKIPFMELWNGHTANVLAGMGARYIDGVFFNVFGVFSITYLTTTLKVDRSVALMGVMAAAVIMCFTIPFFGRMADRVGKAKLYFYGSILTGLSAFPAFWMMAHNNGSNTLIWISIIIPFGILYSMVYAPESSLFADLFDAKIRYTGISFVYQFSGIFASGLTPIIATSLLKLNNGGYTYLCAYVVFAAVISAFSANWIHRNNNGSQIPNCAQNSVNNKKPQFAQ